MVLSDIPILNERTFPETMTLEPPTMTSARDNMSPFRQALELLLKDGGEYKRFKNNPEAFALRFGLTLEETKAIDLLPERVFSEMDYLKGVNLSDLMRR